MSASNNIIPTSFHPSTDADNGMVSLANGVLMVGGRVGGIPVAALPQNVTDALNELLAAVKQTNELLLLLLRKLDGRKGEADGH